MVTHLRVLHTCRHSPSVIVVGVVTELTLACGDVGDTLVDSLADDAGGKDVEGVARVLDVNGTAVEAVISAVPVLAAL